MTSREIVLKTLNFKKPTRVPRQLWSLPWAEMSCPDTISLLKSDYPADIINSPAFLEVQPITEGDAYTIGTYVDEWGCVFTQRENCFIGEVKYPISTAEDYGDFNDHVHIPVEWLSADISQVNNFCRDTSKFVLAGCCPRPFERMQFIRGTEQFLVDLMLQEEGMFKAMEKLHEFYKQLLSHWAASEVDGLMIMDDWGSQQSLLVNPELWRSLFKPMYREYAEIAKKYGKKLFMHSDGYILDIYPDLIEIGVDAVNSQIFCMGVEQLSQFAGKITFWGEIDRQYTLSRGSLKDVEESVKRVYTHLYKDGGCIAQCEFGPGALGENVVHVFKTWDNIEKIERKEEIEGII